MFSLERPPLTPTAATFPSTSDTDSSEGSDECLRRRRGHAARVPRHAPRSRINQARCRAVPALPSVDAARRPRLTFRAARAQFAMHVLDDELLDGLHVVADERHEAHFGAKRHA